MQTIFAAHTNSAWAHSNPIHSLKKRLLHLSELFATIGCHLLFSLPTKIRTSKLPDCLYISSHQENKGFHTVCQTCLFIKSCWSAPSYLTHDVSRELQCMRCLIFNMKKLSSAHGAIKGGALQLPIGKKYCMFSFHYICC